MRVCEGLLTPPLCPLRHTSAPMCSRYGPWHPKACRAVSAPQTLTSRPSTFPGRSWTGGGEVERVGGVAEEQEWEKRGRKEGEGGGGRRSKGEGGLAQGSGKCTWPFTASASSLFLPARAHSLPCTILPTHTLLYTRFCQVHLAVYGKRTLASLVELMADAYRIKRSQKNDMLDRIDAFAKEFAQA